MPTVIKKTSIIALLLFSFVLGATAQYRYAVRANGYAGKIMRNSTNLDSIAKGMVWGGELAFEWYADGEKEWQHFWGFPSIGIGLGAINLGNNQLLGGAIFAYPYVLAPIVRGSVADFNIKIGAGLSYVSKTWKDGKVSNNFDLSTANSAISFPVNLYLNGSANVEVFLSNRMSLTADFGLSHISNGSFKNPNYGINILHSQLGLKYNLDECRGCKKLTKNPAYSLPFEFQGNITLSGFSKQISFFDKKNFFVGSLHAGIVFPMSNWYALGGGINVFYDGAFTNRPTEQNPYFDRYKIDQNKFLNKIRAGVSFDNEIILGRVVAILGWGIYLYDPIKNAYAEPHKKHGFNRPIFYSYNHKKEDGWNWWRMGVRYRFFDNIFVSFSAKFRLKTCEMLQLGVGYLLPFAKNKHSSLSNSIKNLYFYHYDQVEAPAFPTPWLR